MSAFFNLMTYCRGTCMNTARYGRVENGLVIFYCKECRYQTLPGFEGVVQ